jgi:hypothetical protein
MIEGGNVHIPNSASWLKEYRNQFMSFPSNGQGMTTAPASRRRATAPLRSYPSARGGSGHDRIAIAAYAI